MLYLDPMEFSLVSVASPRVLDMLQLVPQNVTALYLDTYPAVVQGVFHGAAHVTTTKKVRNTPAAAARFFFRPERLSFLPRAPAL